MSHWPPCLHAYPRTSGCKVPGLCEYSRFSHALVHQQFIKLRGHFLMYFILLMMYNFFGVKFILLCLYKMKAATQMWLTKVSLFLLCDTVRPAYLLVCFYFSFIDIRGLSIWLLYFYLVMGLKELRFWLQTSIYMPRT